jgi:8-oxo-dGTP pyrophosphatase MutT (NUDIX family)
MTESVSGPQNFSDRDAFLTGAVEKLGTNPCDFQETFRRITSSGKKDGRRAAGVLLPIVFRESVPGCGQFVFQLIKRSLLVPQPGDLSLPGGLLHPLLDRIMRPFLIHGPFPIINGKARAYALRQSGSSFHLVTLFMANALRETWEEIRLSPLRVRFLGCLPSYNLALFQRTIFPLAGFVDHPNTLKPNREVEKIVEIPLLSFFRRDLYGCFRVSTQGSAGSQSLEYPCLIHRDSDGKDEILWGATFSIILSFLEIVTSWQLPEWRQGLVITRNLSPDYLTGRPPSEQQNRFHT